jgi:hypothetical protein
MWPFELLTTWTPDDARKRLQNARAPSRMRVTGRLNLVNAGWLTCLPRKLEAETIDISGCARLSELPEKLRCGELRLQRTQVKCLPAGLEVSWRIDATECECLRAVGALRVPELFLRGCTALVQLADGLRVRRLDVSRCGRLTELPASMAKGLWDLDVSDCQSLTELPSGLGQLRTLNLRGCTNLRSLPADMRVQSWIEVADSGIEALPQSLQSAQVVWRGVRVPDRIAFDPDTITVREIFRETNVELRRVLLERVGMEWFCENAQTQIVDRDVDAGGERRLLRVAFDGGEDEDIVCLEVRCPSTARKYLLRVPPQTTGCAQAAAWLAGFRSARQYRPLVET